MNRLTKVLYFAALSALLTVGCALVFSRWTDAAGPTGGDLPSHIFTIGFIVSLTVVAVLCGINRWRYHRRRFFFANVLFACWLPLVSGSIELLLGFATPAWPAQALHGVFPEDSRRLSVCSSGSDSVGINSWGQHDRERTIRPSESTYRIGFVGDSFLEESIQPVSIVVEELLRRDDCEVINLGVSSTQPDEYYYRLRTVAVPLGCRHCVVWLFSGNDFVDEPRTLPRMFSCFAVAPRPALATFLGLRSINHVITNRHRPVLQAWMTAGDLARRESELFQQIQQMDDQTLREVLLRSSATDDESVVRLSSRLYSEMSDSFLAMLRAPDAGRFRSYYLTAGLWSVAQDAQWERNPETHAIYWAFEMDAICQEKGIRLTFVVIPEAFQVDRRMQNQWSALTDMQHLTKPCREAAERFCIAARVQGLDVLDLHAAFADVPGTYLNLDGHWSQKGVDLAAKTVLDHLKPQLPAR